MRCNFTFGILVGTSRRDLTIKMGTLKIWSHFGDIQNCLNIYIRPCVKLIIRPFGKFFNSFTFAFGLNYADHCSSDDST